MKKILKKILPVFVLATMLSSTLVCASSVYWDTKISVGRGKTATTAKHDMRAGTGRIAFDVNKINGSSNKNEDNSSKLHIIVRDANDTTLADDYRDVDNHQYHSTHLIYGNGVRGAAGKWYAQFSTKINGISYASFASDWIRLTSV